MAARSTCGASIVKIAKGLRRVSLASRFDSGSFINKACGSRTMARPIATRCRWPPDSAVGLRFR
jgi:hypothetical protein